MYGGPDPTPTEVNGTFATSFNGNRMGLSCCYCIEMAFKPILCQDVGFSVSIAEVWAFYLNGNNNFFESWPTVLAQPDLTRWGCSNEAS